jgi:hypothetical protein
MRKSSVRDGLQPEVNFVEFCTFLGQCQDEFREARGEMDGDKNVDTLSLAAKRLSALAIHIPTSELEALDAGEELTELEAGDADLPANIPTSELEAADADEEHEESAQHPST